MKVEVLWWRGCPSWERAIELVREEMAGAGLDPGALIVREIEDQADAEREGFPGSPTVRVGGRDIIHRDAGKPEPAGLSCRVYRLRDGRASPLPDRADVHDALAGAQEGDPR